MSIISASPANTSFLDAVETKINNARKAQKITKSITVVQK
jgi:hypothetical protein